MIIKTILILCFLNFSDLYSNEIIRDKNGNYFLMKRDGTFKKLPPLKPGKKYIIKKNIEKKKIRSIKEKKRDTRSAKKHISKMKE